MSAVVIRSLAAGCILLGLAAGLSACTTTATDDTTGTDTGTTDEGTEGTTDEGTEEEASGDFVVVPGTGSYVIGVDIPLGGFQVMGEPVEQPAGCTWAILDGDGNAIFENQGVYVFLTDIPEAVTFQTDGCPEWEQFE